MAITSKSVKLEDLKYERTKRTNDKTIFKVGKHFENGSLQERLDVEHHYNFKSLLGNTYSLNNFMKYLMYENARPVWINNELKHEDYAFMKRKGVKRNVPNYWNIVTLVFVDRVLADKQLITDADRAFPGEELNDIRIMPMIEVKRGITKVETFNDRLKTYGIISGINLRQIVNEFRDTFGTGCDAKELNSEDYKKFKTNVKTKIINKIFVNLKSDNLFDGFDDNVTNDGIKEAYLK
jgi:hypothetical protein